MYVCEFTVNFLFLFFLDGFCHVTAILLQIAYEVCLCFMCSLWRDLNINCCDEKSCNFYNNTNEKCMTLVCVDRPAGTFWLSKMKINISFLLLR